MNITFNKRIQRLIKLARNCHCTHRSILTQSSAIARALSDNEVRGYIFWDLYGDTCRIFVKVGQMGIKHKTKFSCTESDEEINAKLYSIFSKMDSSWQIETI